MAKVTKEQHQPKRKKTGLQSINKHSNHKHSKNYRKKNRGQGKGR